MMKDTMKDTINKNPKKLQSPVLLLQAPVLLLQAP
jgi:hypothetical protein